MDHYTDMSTYGESDKLTQDGIHKQLQETRKMTGEAEIKATEKVEWEDNWLMEECW